MFRFAAGLGSVMLLLAGAGFAGAAETNSASKDLIAPLPLKVVGGEILDSRGEAVRLMGVNCACLEWASDGEGHIVESVKTAIEDRKVNTIRLPMSQEGDPSRAEHGAHGTHGTQNR